MRRIVAVLLTAALAASCASSPDGGVLVAEADPTTTLAPATTEATTTTAASPDEVANLTGVFAEDPATAGPVIPLSYLIKQSQIALVGSFWQQFFYILNYQGGRIGGTSPLIPTTINGRSAWRVNNQRLWSQGGGITIQWTNVTLDPSQSEWEYGKTQVSSDSSEQLPAQSYIFDNCQDDTDLEIDESHTVTLQQSRSTSTSTTISDDVTAGAKVDTKVGGFGEGVNLEASISNTFGWSTDTAKAASESQATTVTVELKKTIKANTRVVATLGTGRVVSATPFTARGPWTGGLTIWILPSWIVSWNPIQPLTGAFMSVADSGGNVTYSWDTLDEFTETFYGYNVNMPQFNPSNTAVMKPHIDWLASPNSRWIELHGTQRRNYQSGADYEFVTADCKVDLKTLITRHNIPAGNVRTQATEAAA